MTDVVIHEVMQGTCLYTDHGTAKKVGQGWKVTSRVGKIFNSVRWQAPADEYTNVKYVKTKAQARKELTVIEYFARAKSMIP